MPTDTNNQHAGRPGEAGAPPRVWVVTGYRAGERTQVLALAEALGWPFEIKELSYRKAEFRTSLFRGSDLRGIRRTESSPLQLPWPDLLISAGMRNEPPCRWVRDQAGGRPRIVHVGRPWAALERFDMIVTTPQYRLVQAPNVLHNVLTMHRVTGNRLQDEAARLCERLADLPRPLISVIVGGNSGPYTFGRRAAKRLAAEASALAASRGGSLLVTTSARTVDSAINALQARIDVPCDFYRWQPDDRDNPYYGYLALADAHIVTADSISMLTEACATRKPVYMFDIGSGWLAMREPALRDHSFGDFRLGGWLYRLMMAIGPKRLSRDINLVHQALIRSGRAVWLGDTFPQGQLPPLQDLDNAVARVRALFEDR